MTRRGWLLACSSVLCTGGAVYGVYAVTRRWRKAPPPARDSAAEGELLQLINAERVRCKYKTAEDPVEKPLPALVPDESLQQIALAHAENLAFTRMVEASSPGALSQELLSSGYVFKYCDKIPAYLDHTTLAAAFAGWMSDPKHKVTKGLILNPYLVDIGVGVLRDAAADAFYVYILLATKRKY